jgi:atypical dual specificity phosphatase
MSILSFSWVVAGKLGGHQAPSSEQDLISLKKQGILALVRMIESDKADISSNQIDKLGMSDCHEPVTDFGTPKPEQITRIIKFIDKSISAKRPVGVSCKAGLGRTGTILACYLVSQGYAADVAINEIRKKRPGSIETEGQENAIKTYASTIDKTHDPKPGQSNSEGIKFPIRQWPFPIEEAADIVISRMDEMTKDAVAKSVISEALFSDIWDFHDNVGRWIRNAFGLWNVPGLDADDAWIPIFLAVRDKLREKTKT